MKRILSLFLLLLLNVATFAQWDISEQNFDGYKVLSMASDPSGFFVLTKTEREELSGYTIKTYARPALVHYDRDFQEQWRITFRETNLPELENVQLLGDEIYLTGSHYLPNDRGCQHWIVCLNRSGQILWDKKYGYPSYNSVEGRQVYRTPDGNLILTGMAYRLENSYGSPIITKLQPNGTLIWQRLYGTQYVLPSFSDGVLTEDGMLTMAGHVYPDQTWFRREVSKGWVVKINCASKGELVWEKQFAIGAHTQFSDIIKLPSGDFGIVGGAGESVNLTSNLTLVLSSTGEILVKDIWKNNATANLVEITCNPVEGRYYVTGRTNVTPSNIESLQTEMVILDEKFQRLDEVIVDAHAMRDPQCGPHGGILTHGQESLLIFREQ